MISRIAWADLDNNSSSGKTHGALTVPRLCPNCGWRVYTEYFGEQFDRMVLKCFQCKGDIPERDYASDPEHVLSRLWNKTPMLLKIVFILFAVLLLLWIGSMIGEYTMSNPWPAIVLWLAVPVIMAFWLVVDTKGSSTMRTAGFAYRVSFGLSMVLSFYVWGCVAQQGSDSGLGFREPLPLYFYVPVMIGVFLVPFTTFRLAKRVVENTAEYRFYQRQYDEMIDAIDIYDDE